MFVCTLALIVIIWAVVWKVKDKAKNDKDDDFPPFGGAPA